MSGLALRSILARLADGDLPERAEMRARVTVEQAERLCVMADVLDRHELGMSS